MSTAAPRPSSRARDAFLTLAAAGLLTLLAWPFDRSVETGLDPSWMQALQLAFEHGLRFGTEIVYTYGPLGFLSVPTPPVGIGSTIALVASAAVYVTLAATALFELRRWLPWWAALGIAFVGCRMWTSLPPFEAFQVLVFIAGSELVLDRVRLDHRLVIVLAGVASAVAALGKLNVGVFVAAMALITVLAVVRPWWRGLVGYLVTGAVATLALWLVLGQALPDLVAYVRGAAEIISGYSQAMGTDRDPPSRHWIFPVFVGIAALIGWLTVRGTRDASRTRRLALGGLVALLLFAEWKTAFVRGYPGYAFATLAFAVTPLVVGTRRSVALATLAVIWVAFVLTAPPRTTTTAAQLDVVGSVRSAVGSARDSLVPWNIDESAERTRAALRDEYDLSPETLALLSGQRTHIEPSEAAVAQAHRELIWAPLPVFQTYHAYTPALDDLDAERLRGDERPERILREYAERADGSGPLTVDGRFYWFDAPATTLERLCRYREVSADERWQVLAPDGAGCGEEIPLGTVTVPAGTPVEVPAAPSDEHVVVVRISALESGLVDRLRAALFKAREWYVDLDRTRYRLVPGTVGQGLVLAVPPGIAGSGPFDFGPAVTSMVVGADPDGQGSDEPITYEFVARPILDPPT